LKELGLDPQFAKFSGSGAWTEDTAMYEMARSGLIGERVTSATLVRFYLSHPARAWRHAKAMLPIAFSLRPEWCGNFEQSAGRGPGAKSHSFSLWSTFHQRVLTPAGRAILIVLLLAPIALVAGWIRWPKERIIFEFALLLSLSALAVFAVPVYSDAWDNVKHMFLFNLAVDTGLVWMASFLWSLSRFLQSNK
jgi:hypothetical protein